jgi:hypothetical protein
MPFIVTIKRDVEITDQSLFDLLVTAREGGSNYWMEGIKYTKPQKKFTPVEDEVYPFVDYPLNGGTVKITHNDIEQHTLTREGIERGLVVMAEKYPRHMNDFIIENYDADTADVFLQCCVFGELVYG